MPALTHIIRDKGAPDSDIIVFDAVVSEMHEGEAEITTHSVETGAPIADHVRAMPAHLIIEARVTNRPIDETLWDADGAKGSTQAKEISYLEMNNLPISLPGVSSLLSVVGAKTKVSKQNVTVLSYNQEFNRVSTVYSLLELVRTNCELVTIATPLRAYYDMVLTRVSAKRELSGMLPITIEARQVRFVDTAQAPAGVSKKRSKGPQPAKAVLEAAADAGVVEAALHKVAEKGRAYLAGE